MSQAIAFSQTMTANQYIAAQTTVADHQFNPVERRARLSVYARSSVAGGNLFFSVGSRQYLVDDVLPITTGALSTRDHLVATGVAFAKEKITIGLRETAGATPTIVGRVVIQPM